MKKTLMLLAALLVLLIPPGARADVTVGLSLDRTEATPADSVQMKVTITGTGKGAPQPILRGVELFHVTQGGTSSRVEIINGKFSSSLEYAYYLQPKHTGTFGIGPAEVTFEGRTYRSDTVRLLVTKPETGGGADRGPVFLTSELSSGEVFVEGQAVYTLKLYRRANVRDISLSLPEIEHLSFTQLEKPREYRSVYRGQPYQVLEVLYAIVPSREGEYSLPPPTMNMTLLQPEGRSPRGFFEDPFFSFQRGRPLTITGDPLELRVLALPREGRPPDFNGLVGRFEMDFRLEPSTVKAGESATLTVSVRGRGNVNLIPDLKVPEQDRVKVYADQPVLKAEQDAQGLGGSKTMKWALVPEGPGTVEIPPLEVGFFDTDTRRYRTLRTPSQVLSVLPGEEEKTMALRGEPGDARTGGQGKETVRELGRDILPVHTAMKDFAPSGGLQPGDWSFRLILLGPVLLYLIALGAVSFQRRSLQSLAAARARGAARDLVRECRHGELSSGRMIEIIRDYLNRRCGLSLGALTPDEAFQILTSRGVGEDRAEEMRALLRRLEDAVYTGRGLETCELGRDLAGLVRDVEREIR